MSEYDYLPADSATRVLDEAESLIWALLDDQLDDAETTRLSKLLEEHESVRRRYLECVQLHVDLHDYFAVKTSRDVKDAAKATPILPNLMPGSFPGAPTPIVE